MKPEIESLWYQRKMTGYGQNGPFPTEMTIVFTVGENVMLPNNMMREVETIVFNKSEHYISFKDGSLLTLQANLNPEILYKSTKNGDTKKENN